MGWYIWPDTGKLKDWPCPDTCLICGEQIRGGTKYYLVEGGAEHAVCAWKRADDEQQSLRNAG